MPSLLRAEWRKLTGHPTLIVFTLGVLPLGLALLHTFRVIGLLLNAPARAGVPPPQWINEAGAVWGLLNSDFSFFGRVLPLAFMALAFTTEYHAGTWKTVLPGRRREVVLLAKFIVITFMVWVSFLVLAGVAVLGAAAQAALSGQAYGPGVPGQGWGAFLSAFGRESLLGLYTLMFLGWVAALSAGYSHSPLVVIVTGVLLSGLENVAAPLLLLLSRSLQQPAVANWYQFAPAYNLLNLRSWLVAHTAVTLPAPFTLSVAPGALFSVVVLAAWLAGLAALALWIFQRQDITA